MDNVELDREMYNAGRCLWVELSNGDPLSRSDEKPHTNTRLMGSKPDT